MINIREQILAGIVGAFLGGFVALVQADNSPALESKSQITFTAQRGEQALRHSAPPVQQENSSKPIAAS